MRRYACTRPITRIDRHVVVTNKNLLISATELGSALANPALRVVDCRFQLLDPDAGRKAYVESHIPGAVYADLDKDLAGAMRPGTGRHPLPDVTELSATFSRMGIDGRTSVVVYDDSSGAVAARAWWLLRWLGHADVRLLDGGLAEWQRHGLPVQTGEVSVAAANFDANPRQELVLTTDELCEDGQTIAAICLVDARDTARFIGDEEPIDPVAGHIPGAMNLPLSRNLDHDGLWKRPAELAAGLREVLGEAYDAPWAVMCGSGVTACHLVIAALQAGYREPRVYVGSWSEWIADPARPVATGPD